MGRTWSWWCKSATAIEPGERTSAIRCYRVNLSIASIRPHDQLRADFPSYYCGGEGKLRACPSMIGGAPPLETATLAGYNSMRAEGAGLPAVARTEDRVPSGVTPGVPFGMWGRSALLFSGGFRSLLIPRSGAGRFAILSRRVDGRPTVSSWQDFLRLEWLRTRPTIQRSCP
jgi:hypothetical protein